MRRSHFAFLASGFLLGLLVAGGIQLARQPVADQEPPAPVSFAPVALTMSAPVERPGESEARQVVPYGNNNWRLNGADSNSQDPPPPAHYWSKKRINGIPYYIVPLTTVK